MKLGIASDSLGASTLAEAFKCASQVGAEGVEVHYSSAKDIRALGRKKHPDELKALAQEHGLAVPSLALIGLCRQPSLIGDPKTIADSQKSIL
ncbi:MAG: hypothetical protein KAU28_00840, partial [Phycisphaerae bacterium]|nr:hypothetical protein [Phycisphaerae bacterium]